MDMDSKHEDLAASLSMLDEKVEKANSSMFQSFTEIEESIYKAKNLTIERLKQIQNDVNSLSATDYSNWPNSTKDVEYNASDINIPDVTSNRPILEQKGIKY